MKAVVPAAPVGPGSGSVDIALGEAAGSAKVLAVPARPGRSQPTGPFSYGVGTASRSDVSPRMEVIT